MSPQELLLKQAWAIYQMNVPYLYGGATLLEGIDCSQFVVILLRSQGVIKYMTDYSANGLWTQLDFEHRLPEETPGPAWLAFYGRDDHPTHVGVVLETLKHMMSFAGGDGTTLRLIDAAVKNAGCHIYPIDYRRDLLGFVNPFEDV